MSRNGVFFRPADAAVLERGEHSSWHLRACVDSVGTS